MKKTVIFGFLLLSIAATASAQLFDLAKHEVRVFGGDGAALAPIFSVLEHKKNENDYAPVSGSFGADYTYCFFKNVAFGGGFVFSMINKKHADDEEIDKATQYLNFSFFGEIKGIYFKTEYLKFYCAASVGVGGAFARTGRFGSIVPVLQLSPFCVRVGTDTMGFFVDFGYGTTGIVTAGLLLNIY